MSKTPMEPGTYTAVDNKKLAMFEAGQKFCEEFCEDHGTDLAGAEESTVSAFRRWRKLWDKPPATKPANNPPLTFDQARALETVWLTWPADIYPYPAKGFLEKSNQGWNHHDVRALEDCIRWGGTLHAHNPAEAVLPTLPTEDEPACGIELNPAPALDIQLRIAKSHVKDLMELNKQINKKNDAQLDIINELIDDRNRRSAALKARSTFDFRPGHQFETAEAFRAFLDKFESTVEAINFYTEGKKDRITDTSGYSFPSDYLLKGEFFQPVTIHELPIGYALKEPFDR